MAQLVKNLPTMQETWARSLSREDPQEKGMATHSCLDNSMDRGAWWATSPIICSILYWLRFEDDIVNYLSESLFLKKNTFILFPPGPLSVPLGYPQPVWEGWHNEESNPPEEPGGLTWKQSDVTDLVKTWSRVVSAEKAIKKKMRKMLNI